jgi:hypothetical protein
LTDELLFLSLSLYPLGVVALVPPLELLPFALLYRISDPSLAA